MTLIPDHQHHWEAITFLQCGGCGAPIPCLLCGALLTSDTNAYCLACTDLLDSVDLDYAEERVALYNFLQAVLIGARLAGQVGPAAHAVARQARVPWLELRRAEGYVDLEDPDDAIDPADLGSLGADLTEAELHPPHAQLTHGWIYTARGWRDLDLTAVERRGPGNLAPPRPVRPAAPARPVRPVTPQAQATKAAEQLARGTSQRQRKPKRK